MERSSRTRLFIVIATGVLIAVLAIGEMVDQEVTVWNGITLILGAFMVAYGFLGLQNRS